MILRDFYCAECGYALADVESELNEVTACRYCPKCDEDTSFHAMCNGGLNSRWRFADFSDNPLDYEGQITTGGVQAHFGNGAAVTNPGGDVLHDTPALTDNDVRAERRDRITHEEKVRQGKTPLFIDQKQG